MTVAAVERAVAVIEALAGQPEPLELSTLAARADLPASAAHRTMATLIARGWVVQDPDSQNYALSLRLPMLAFRMLDASHLPDVIQAALDRLAEETREYCRLALVQSGHLFWVARAQGARHGLRYDPDMGEEIVLHATANGKAWLSTFPEDEAVGLARPGLGNTSGVGPNCIRCEEELRLHLRETVARGYAVSLEEAEVGASALAVPVRAAPEPNARVVGTISVAGPSLRLTPDRFDTLVAALCTTADEMQELWPLHLRQGGWQTVPAVSSLPAVAE